MENKELLSWPRCSSSTHNTCLIAYKASVLFLTTTPPPSSRDICYPLGPSLILQISFPAPKQFRLSYLHRKSPRNSHSSPANYSTHFCPLPQRPISASRHPA